VIACQRRFTYVAVWLAIGVRHDIAAVMSQDGTVARLLHDSAGGPGKNGAWKSGPRQAKRTQAKRTKQTGQEERASEDGMYTLYSMQRSGNSYKVRLALAQLGIPYRLVEVDILRGESRTPEFLAKNPSGQVPLLEVAPGRHIAESNAILWYVAGGSPLAADDRISRAEALQWMFFEQHSLEPNIGAAYFWLALVKGGRELQQHAMEDWLEQGYRALRVMENHLKEHRYFVADRYTVADIALYAYTHVAHECDFDLGTFPAIGDWLDRMAAQPGHVRMEQQPADMAAE
jgi:glutathione S-transferase